MFQSFKYIFITILIIQFCLIVSNFTRSSKDNENSFGKKYVIYECTNDEICGGWADRLKGIMSAYAWSLITNREFLINIQKPCDLTELLQPNQIDWKLNLTNILKIKSRVKLWKIDDKYFRKRLKYVSLQEIETKAQVISIKNNLIWLKSLSLNKHLRKRIVELGFKPEYFRLKYLFRDWYMKFFKLNPKFQLKYDKFLAEINGSKLICAQVRIGGARKHVKYDGKFTERNNTKIYWNYIRNNLIKNLTNYKLFLTTDTNDVELEAIQEFGNDKVIVNEGINSHLDREINSKDCNRVEKTFLDFHALQNCDRALISESGFGKYGLMNRKFPTKNLFMFSKKQQFIELI